MDVPSLINVAYAQTSAASTFISNFTREIINPLIKLFIALAVVVFLWGVVDFISKSGDASAVDTGRRHLIWGILGLAIMVSVFGIMNLICNTINC